LDSSVRSRHSVLDALGLGPPWVSGDIYGVDVSHVLPEWAASESRRLVEPLGRRWLHVQAVAGCADDVAKRLGLDRAVLSAAAWLHDIGYAEELRSTGFHPLDGARHLRRTGCDRRVLNLVAHHSCARFEADLRGLANELVAEFKRPESEYEDALCYCDMTNGPAGDRVDAQDRLNEIRTRYGPEHLVTRFIDVAESEILASVRRVEVKLAAS